MKLRDLSPPHIRAFKARKNEFGLNPNTVGVMQGVLSAAFNRAVDDGLIFQNPASRLKKAATRREVPVRSTCLRRRLRGSYAPPRARQTGP